MNRSGADEDAAAAELDVPSLEGKNVLLRPITGADVEFLRASELSEPLGAHWRFRGATPGPEEWNRATWPNTLAQFMVIGKRTNMPLGYVALHHANFQDGHASLSVARLGPDQRAPAFILGAALFVDYAFACWNFRKIYMEVAEYNYAQVASGLGRYFVMEGRMRDHTWAGGRLWDQIILAIYRDGWKEKAGSALALERPD